MILWLVETAMKSVRPSWLWAIPFAFINPGIAGLPTCLSATMERRSAMVKSTVK